MSWIAVGIGAAIGAGGGAIIGSKKGGDDVWKGALLGGVLGAAGGGIGGAALGGAGAAAEGAAGAGAAEGALGAGIGEGALGSALPTGAAALPGAEAFGGAAALESGSMAAIPGVTPAAGVFPSSVPATMQASVPGAVVGGPGTSAAGAGGSGGILQGLTNFASNNKGLMTAAGTLGLGALLAQDNKKYGVPEQESYSGPLSQFKYSPTTFTPTQATPSVYRAHYADGGIAQISPTPSMMQTGPANVDYMGGDMYPQSQINSSHYSTPSQMPTSAQQAAVSYEPKTNPLTGEAAAGMADGGIASLGSYSDGGQLLKGPGDGVSDSIPASIAGKQPARLASGEFVVPARAVSELGNGSTDAGAKQLYGMLDRIQSKRKKGKGLAYQAHPKKIMPA